MKFIWPFMACCLVFLPFVASSSTFYVDANGTNPIPPYADWSTAATTIQDAVDAANDGDMVLVTNGIYQIGGQVVYGSVTNRVAVTKAIVVQSVNGAANTVIAGYQVSGTTNDDAAVRCVYMAAGATLAGFTLTNGATHASDTESDDWYQNQSGGGVWCDTTNPVISDCIIVGNAAGDSGAGGINGTFINCTFLNNFADDAGGAVYNSTLSHCVLDGNIAHYAGGGGYYPYWVTNRGVVCDCVFTNNNSGFIGGGVWGGHIYRCMFAGNVVTDDFFQDGEAFGGGAQYGVLVDCIFAGNEANAGGGADTCYLYNCLFTNNDAAFSGGGVSWSYCVNCTVVNNYAGQCGGGADGSYLENCIVYFNDAPTNENVLFGTNSEANYTCSTPLLPGVGNFCKDPLLVDLAGGNLHLQAGSPCINAGSNYYLTNNFYGLYFTNDLDGNPRIAGGTVDVGVYELQSPSSVISYLWLQQYGLPTDGSADYADSDGDGMNNWQEWRTGTNPTNALSLLKMVPVAQTNNSGGVTVTWQSVAGINYFLQRGSDLALPLSTIESNIAGQDGTTSYDDETATDGVPYFYRVGVP